MARSAKRSPMESFNDSMDDAEALVTYSWAFQNHRSRRMRAELRDRVGEALKIPINSRGAMDCIENGDLFIVFRDSEELGRERFDDLRPLLRQSIVAACAALETYVADKVMDWVGSSLQAEELPKKLRGIPLTVGHWSDIERTYTRRAWGIRGIVEEAVREQASTAPNKIGHVLGIIGIEKWSKKIDQERGVRSGSTVSDLHSLTWRRNRIAHSADRVGQGRAGLTVEEAEGFLRTIRSIAEAIDRVVDHNAL